MAHDHSHPGGMELLDALAAHSPLRFVHPGLKLAFALAVIFAAIGAAHWAVGLFITASMVCAMGALGGIPLRCIGALLRAPLLFLAVGCLVVLLEWSRQPAGLWSAALGGRCNPAAGGACPGGRRRRCAPYSAGWPSPYPPANRRTGSPPG